MNCWRKLFVLWMLCVTLPLQAVASLRTHCGTEAAGQPGVMAMTMPMSMDATMGPRDAASAELSQAAADGATAMSMHDMHHVMDDRHDADGMARHVDAATSGTPSPSTSPGHLHQQAHHGSCSACAACVVCTAPPPSVALRAPDGAPSEAIPFLRNAPASAFRARLERPPRSV